MIVLLVIGIILAWFALSCAIGVLIGRMIAAGRGEDEE